MAALRHHDRSDPGLAQFLGGGLFHDIKWTPLQISIWPLHLCSPCCLPDVYGLAVSPGWIGVASRVYGISGGSFLFLQRENYGVTTGLVTAGGLNNALSCGIFNSWEENNGISIGLANIVYGRRYCWNTLQIGVFNKANNGLQIGVFNQVMPDAVIENNFSAPEKPEGFGVQTGIVNYSEGKGLQFGLWNTNPNAWIKHFPLFNFAF